MVRASGFNMGDEAATVTNVPGAQRFWKRVHESERDELGQSGFVAVWQITAFMSSDEMAVAYFYGHAMTATGINIFLPTVNKGELAVIYCWFFLYLSSQGPGAFTLDNILGSRRSP